MLDRELKAVKRAVARLERSAAKAKYPDLESAALVWDEVDQVRRRLADTAASVKSVAARFKNKPEFLVLPNGSTLKLGYSKPRKTWDHSRLAGVVAEKVLRKHVNEETGVIEAPTSVLMVEMFQYAHTDYWRVKALRDDLGLDPDKYCDAGQAEFSLQPVRSDLNPSKGK